MLKNRLAKLAASLPQDVDAALITSEVNRFYLTGLKTDAGMLIVFRQSAYLIVDFRYMEIAEKTVTDCKLVLQDNLIDQLNQLIAKHKAKIVSIEDDAMTVRQMNAYKNTLQCALDVGGELSTIISEMRQTKSPDELESLAEAQKIAEKALQETLSIIRPGITEKELALRLDFRMLKYGAEALSFDTIVLFGQTSSMPHGIPSNNRLRKGDSILIDFGCVVNGCHSDMTRTFFYNRVYDRDREVYEIVLAAQQAALNMIRPGVSCAEVDAVARNIIASAGYGDCFGHSLGHGVGLEVHEAPNLSPKSTGILCENNTVTVEPGIYISGQLGVRIEDFVVVTADGCRNFTSFDKSLTII